MALSAPSLSKNESAPPPRHVAIIMDGNGRWAKKRLMNRSLGHKRGAEAVREAIQGAMKNGVEFLTLYAFSTENWNRPQEEVKDLMGLLKTYLSKEIDELNKQDIRLKVIGNRDRLSPDIKAQIAYAERMTENNARLTLVIALSYGSREEMLEATKQILTQVQNGDMSVEQITEDTISGALYTADIPDPDLIIRTSGEQRLSNFLMWQAAYSEFLFLDVLWPDFTEDDFTAAVKDYALRDRRYGLRL